jgi:hypothetical protein
VSATARRPFRLGDADALAFIGALSFLAARALPFLDVHVTCPSRALFGIPCATCGMTRAFVRLAAGDAAGAVAASPAGAALAAAAWAFALAALARPVLRFDWPRPSAAAARALAVAAIATLALNWIYLVATGARA